MYTLHPPHCIGLTVESKPLYKSYTHTHRLGVFTGWEDAPLANEGRVEARKAGRLLKRHGIELDVVYTSWLSRAIETAWLLLDELDCVWLPIIKSWRLNERMYGALTGLSKKMIAQRHGEARFRQWRRSYATRPPEVSSFSAHYPGNDDRYVKVRCVKTSQTATHDRRVCVAVTYTCMHVNASFTYPYISPPPQYVSDLRVSVRETLIRSLSDLRFKLHRKYPKTESLKDCMSRTIPFFTDTIVPQSIAKGKTVLVASSENAIRGLLMHLCDIPSDRIAEVEIPTGLPLIYNVNKRCIQLLETGEEDPSDPIGHLGACVTVIFMYRSWVGWVRGEDTDADLAITTSNTPPCRLRHRPGAALPALRRERRPVLHRRGGSHLQVRPLDPPPHRGAERGHGRRPEAAAADVVHGGIAVSFVVTLYCLRCFGCRACGVERVVAFCSYQILRVCL